MYDRKELGTEECLKATEAMFRKAKEDGGRPIVVAIVDTHGEIICYNRMDGYLQEGAVTACSGVANQECIKKAYTAAIWRRDTRKLAKRMRELNVSVSEEFSTAYTTMPGGVAIVKPGENNVVYGAIGVGGHAPGLENEVIAFIGLKTIQGILWPSE